MRLNTAFIVSVALFAFNARAQDASLAGERPLISQADGAPQSRGVPNPSSLWMPFVCASPPAKKSQDCLDTGMRMLKAMGCTPSAIQGKDANAQCTLQRLKNKQGTEAMPYLSAESFLNNSNSYNEKRPKEFWRCAIKTVNCYMPETYSSKGITVPCPNQKTAPGVWAPDGSEHNSALADSEEEKTRARNFLKDYPLLGNGGGVGLGGEWEAKAGATKNSSDSVHVEGQVCVPDDKILAKWSAHFPNGLPDDKAVTTPPAFNPNTTLEGI